MPSARRALWPLPFALLAGAAGCQSSRHPPRSEPAGEPGAAVAAASAPAASSHGAHAVSSAAVVSAPPPSRRDAAAPPDEVQLPELPTAPQHRGDTSSTEALRAIFSDYGLPGAPGLTHLCGRRTYHSGGHVTWDAFSAEATPEQLVAHYEARLGKTGFEARPGGGLWRLPARAPARTLEVLPRDASAPHQQCERELPANAGSVLLLSRND